MFDFVDAFLVSWTYKTKTNAKKHCSQRWIPETAKGGWMLIELTSWASVLSLNSGVIKLGLGIYILGLQKSYLEY
jgi:hypothetical protein